MNTETVITVFIAWGAVCATLFVLLYPSLSPGWRKSWIGWALLTSSTALALLLDLALLSKVVGRDYLGLDAIRLCVTFLVALGANLKLAALLREKYRAIHER